jgi:N-acetylmuramoyl-L-alanine amidase
MCEVRFTAPTNSGEGRLLLRIVDAMLGRKGKPRAVVLGWVVALLSMSCDGTNRSEYVVVVDPGHGGANIGAVTRQGLREKDLTLELGMRLRDLLSNRPDSRVVMTRTEDRALGLWDRRDLSNDHRADLFVSIHFNGSPNTTVNRSEVFYSSKVSREAARTFGAMVDSAVGSQDGLVQNVHWTVLWENRARLGALLVEILYLSHQSADDFLASAKNRDVIARGLQRAVNTVLDAEVRRRAVQRDRGVLARVASVFR